MRTPFVSARSFTTALALGSALSALAHDEVDVGRNTGGRLIAHSHAHGAIILEPSVFPGLEGFATGLVGFHSAEIDEPEEDFYTLAPTADIRAVLMRSDHGLFVYDGSNLLEVGQEMSFGSPFFDYHPIFNVPHGHRGEEFTVCFVFRDAAGTHSDSPEFCMTFTPDTGRCFADFNDDGGIDGADVASFFAEWEAGESIADVNEDGGIDGADVGTFFDHWEHAHC
jgi:hypothetical protein